MTVKKPKKRKGRYSFLNDFKLNEANEYEYTGAVYELEGNIEEQKKTLKNTLMLLTGIALALLLAGIVPFEGMMEAFYVIIPYVFEVGFAALLISAAYGIYSHDQLREYVYKKSAGRVGIYGPGLMGNSIIRLVSSTVFLLIKGVGRPLSTMIYYLVLALQIVLEIRAVQTLMRLKYRLVKERKTVSE